MNFLPAADPLCHCDKCCRQRGRALVPLQIAIAESEPPPLDAPLVSGGQGRSPKALRESASVFPWCVYGVCFVVGWVAPMVWRWMVR